MRFEINDDGRVADQAAQWLGALLHENDRPEEFFAWIAQSPQHAQELGYLLADMRDIARLQPEDIARIERLAGELGTDDAAASSVVPLSQRALVALERQTANQKTPARASSSRVRWAFGMAATLLVALGVILWFAGPGSWETYSTRVGEQRALELGDGSIVHMNTDSKIAIRLADDERTVRLVRGEALFSVAHDAARPFRVRSNDVVIQAIGTRFDVYRRAAGTRVSVIEGLVQISAGQEPVPASPAREGQQGSAPSEGPSARLSPAPRVSGKPMQLLAAGEAADVSLAGKISRREAMDAVKAVAWRQRRLVFEDDTLADIAAEFNRYNSRVRIRVADEAAAMERFTATFDADAPETLIDSLKDDPMLFAERVDGEIVIRQRASGLSSH